MAASPTARCTLFQLDELAPEFVAVNAKVSTGGAAEREEMFMGELLLNFEIEIGGEVEEVRCSLRRSDHNTLPLRV